MTDKEELRPIIIVKKIIKKTPHHGGSWKIAYADFVTAMMAFFLLMWLLSMLNKFQLMGISSYFVKPNQNTFIDNKKNDTEDKKIPAEQVKKYKLVMTHKQKAAIDAQSFGIDKSGLNEKEVDKALKKASVQGKKKEDGSSIALKKHLEADIEKSETTKKYKDFLNFDITNDGLKVTLKNLENKPMFSSGHADFEAYAKEILEWLGAELNQANKAISIIGHTDSNLLLSHPHYTNWELSADRANAARRALIKYGVDSRKIIRVQGAADTIPLDKKETSDPKNRRIEIILLTDKAAKKNAGAKLRWLINIMTTHQKEQ